MRKENGDYQVHKKHNRLLFLRNRPPQSSTWTQRTRPSLRTPCPLLPRHQPMFPLQRRLLSTISHPDESPGSQWLQKFAEAASKPALVVFSIERARCSQALKVSSVVP